MRRSILLFLGLISLCTARVSARPLVTEEVATIGKLTFEAGFSISQRKDEFNTPTQTYNTVVFPFYARLGLTEAIEMGITLEHVTQELETGEAKFKGSQTALLSPQLKISPSQYIGLLAIFHDSTRDKENQEMPIARGDDLEGWLLLKAPTAWPLHLNLGYLLRGRYSSKLGVEGGAVAIVEPGDIWEARTSLEIPLVAHIGLLTELAYYKVDTQTIDEVITPNSEGEAMDAFVGLNWAWKGWNIGGAVGGGLLDESHTSFNLERGAGDLMVKLAVAYRLRPRRPGS